MDSAVPEPLSAPPAWAEAAPTDIDSWFELLYRELKRRARGELYRHQALTMGATTLLHETWLRLSAAQLHLASQQDLVRYSAAVMRGIVIDRIRARHAAKRGGMTEHVTLSTLDEPAGGPDRETLAVGEALQALAQHEPALAELVELKFFAGLTLGEIASLRGCSERTAQRDWDKARLLLHAALKA
jgi:RNA polymerase sigma factor (TIGR02999 family)